MTGTITYILARAGWRAMNGPLADERRRLAGAEPPAAYVCYDPRLLAGAGWYGYRIALKGGDRQMVERARYMLAERYIIRDGYEYYADGVYVFGVLLRERVPHYGIGGGAPTPEPDALNFYMPNGGTISLNKTGSPSVVELEYSLDRGATWTVWQEDANGNRSLVLNAGQRMYVRNTSDTSTRFSTTDNNYYQFAFTTDTYANGNTNSLLCKNPSNASLTDHCFHVLFANCTTLITPPLLPSITLAKYCYSNMFRNSGIDIIPNLPATTPVLGCYIYMFRECKNIQSAIINLTSLTSFCVTYIFQDCINFNNLRINITQLSSAAISSNWLYNWLYNVSPTGDFYCPAELTIPTGSNGIPQGWTRHDI